jgi:hypothetical protein
VVELVMFVNVCVPEVAFVPVQPPEAVHAVALVDDQVSVVLPPLAIDVGFADSIAVAAGTDCTVTITLAIELMPPSPLHCALNVVLAVRLFIVIWPDVAIVPLQPPEPVHEVASVDDQVSVVLPPMFTDMGLALSCTVGAGGVSACVLSSPPQATVTAAANVQTAMDRNMANREARVGEECFMVALLRPRAVG